LVGHADFVIEVCSFLETLMDVLAQFGSQLALLLLEDEDLCIGFLEGLGEFGDLEVFHQIGGEVLVWAFLVEVELGFEEVGGVTIDSQVTLRQFVFELDYLLLQMLDDLVIFFGGLWFRVGMVCLEFLDCGTFVEEFVMQLLLLFEEILLLDLVFLYDIFILSDYIFQKFVLLFEFCNDISVLLNLGLTDPQFFFEFVVLGLDLFHNLLESIVFIRIEFFDGPIFACNLMFKDGFLLKNSLIDLL
jgi:hypothetical protein